MIEYLENINIWDQTQKNKRELLRILIAHKQTLY